MKINVFHLKNKYTEAFEFEEKVDLSQENCDEYRFEEPCEAKYTIKFLDNNILLNCKYKLNAKFMCVRCLEEFEKNLDGEFEVIYMRPQEYELYENSNEEKRVVENEVYREKLVGDIIDTYLVLRENILVSIPFANICSPDCKGIEY